MFLTKNMREQTTMFIKTERSNARASFILPVLKKLA